MPDATALPEMDFSRAKAQLSAVMDDVVHKHQPQLIQRKGREAMLLVRPDDLARWLGSFCLDVRLVLDEGEVTAEAPGLGVLGFGESSETALEDLVCELRAYARRFFERSEFYRETDRAKHFPALLRFALTPPDKQLELIHSDIEAAARHHQQEALGSAV
jgi:hypothetical protein